MVNETLFSGTATSVGLAFARSGGAALRQATEGPRHLDLDPSALTQALTSETGGAQPAPRISTAATPVELGEAAAAADANAAYRAGGAGRSPEEARQIGEAFRRELDRAPAALPASASSAERARYATLRHAGEMALLASDVYQDTSNPALLPRGYSALSDAQAQRQFPRFTARDDQSGFYSRIYHDRNTNTYIVVNRGTDDASAPIAILRQTPDGKTNGAFLVGDTSRQAKLALDNARALSRTAPSQVEFAGHSLGGALASLQAMYADKPATVFNPLGISPDTAADYRSPMKALNSNVHSFQVAGEPVAKANRIFGLHTTSQTILLPSRELNWSANDGLQSADNANDPHSTTAVIGGLLNAMTRAK